MRYMRRMKNFLGLNFALCAALALGSLGVAACDKAETKAPAPETAEVVKAEAATATLTAAKTAEASGDEAACDGAEKSEHDGSECMKKSAEAGEGKGCNQWDEAAAAVNKQEIPKDANWQVLKVDGMTCGGCERRIIANVGKLEGVVAVEADSELGQVRVALASGSEGAKTAASDKISELGYKVQ